MQRRGLCSTAQLRSALGTGALAIVLIAAATSGGASMSTCGKVKLFKAHGVIVWSTPNRSRGIFYKSGLAIDADGAFRAYHPNDRFALDSLVHAGRPGNWWALVTDNDKKNGHPVVQGEADPAPGYYVSTTALSDPDNPNVRDPRRYVDAVKIPYVVLHPKALKYARLGDFATVVNLQNGQLSGALAADESASDLPVGEGSIALAEALGIDPNPRSGGEDGHVAYVIYPGSGNGRPRRIEEIVWNSKQLFEMWGGLKKLDACLGQ
jgi:Fungal chitosanase of glycosyl hydrolase group 75